MLDARSVYNPLEIYLRVLYLTTFTWQKQSLFPLVSLVLRLMCSVLALDFLWRFFIWTEFWNKTFVKVGKGSSL